MGGGLKPRGWWWFNRRCQKKQHESRTYRWEARSEVNVSSAGLVSKQGRRRRRRRRQWRRLRGPRRGPFAYRLPLSRFLVRNRVTWGQQAKFISISIKKYGISYCPGSPKNVINITNSNLNKRTKFVLHEIRNTSLNMSTNPYRSKLLIYKKNKNI